MRFNPAGAAMFGMPADANILQDPTMLGSAMYLEGKRITAEQWPHIPARRAKGLIRTA